MGLKTIIIETYKLLIDREYINFFVQMYMKWSKDDGFTSSYLTLIIPLLPRFEKQSLSQFQLYIKAQTTTQCFMRPDCKKTILNRAAAGKVKFFCILHMLSIHTGLRKWSKATKFNIHLKKIFPFGIHLPCIKIVKSELLFEQNRMALNQEKYDIDVRNDDGIKRNRILFDFMQKTFNRPDGLYLREIYLLIYSIMKDHNRKQSAAEIEKPDREKKSKKKERKVHPILLQKILFFE